ncbi:MAG TPA: YwiC-like family protein [Kofleriaceae bacterium]|nr:YwiC-like family protein [Kofleriaceae bacterium]
MSEAPRRSFAPREHGAYGQLGFPLIAALAAGAPQLEAALFAIAAALLFVAHEPALVVLGRRGARARRDHGRAATIRLAIVGALALGCAAFAIVRAPDLIGAAAIPAACAVLLAILVATDVEKTTLGEMIAAIALSSASVPVARASGATWDAALGAWAAWGLGFAAVIAPVRAVIARAKKQPMPPALLAASAGTIAIAIAALTWRREVGAGAALAIAAWSLTLAPPSPRALRAIGWALVAASAATAIGLIVIARA